MTRILFILTLLAVLAGCASPTISLRAASRHPTNAHVMVADERLDKAVLLQQLPVGPTSAVTLDPPLDVSLTMRIATGLPRGDEKANAIVVKVSDFAFRFEIGLLKDKVTCKVVSTVELPHDAGPQRQVQVATLLGDFEVRNVLVVNTQRDGLEACLNKHAADVVAAVRAARARA